MLQLSAQKVIKKVLNNGLTVLIYPLKTTPKVSAQMWYHVGSKDEKTGEKGLAHFLEHMLFKGTAVMSESDINLITHKLSGYCNAFTSFDTTVYLFDMPSQHWDEILPLYADCMRNAKLDQEHLNSELKAVIQELKMYKDDYQSSLLDELIGTIFAEHPYHYPIIGFKQDLWSLERSALLKFYHEHYVPNNATLVIVGDVNPDDAMQKIQKTFNAIPRSSNYKKQQFYWSEDLVSKSITMYRPVENSTLLCAWVVPGLQHKVDYISAFVAWVLAEGKGSRLYKKIVDDLQLATDMSVAVHNFFEYGLFTLEFQLTDASVIAEIKKIIVQEISNLIKYGPTQQEVVRATKKIETDYLSLFENTQKLASAIGETFLATGDENYVFHYLAHAQSQNIVSQMQRYLMRLLRPTAMNTALLMPISHDEGERLDRQQQHSDAIDSRVLRDKIRVAEVEKGVYVDKVFAQKPAPFTYPQARVAQLSNGLAVLYHNNSTLPLIEIILDFKAKYFYEPEHLQGLSTAVSMLLYEGTKKYNGYEMALALESYGMTLSIEPGYISLSMLSQDLEKGLEFLRAILMDALMTQESLEKIKEQMTVDLDAYWDEPSEFVHQLVHEVMYAHHPYSKNMLGTHESIKNITRDDVIQWYKSTLVPGGTTIAVVGDIQNYDVPALLEKMLGVWQGTELPTLQFPILPPVVARDIIHPIQRDQTVLCFAGRSVDRLHPDFDKLLLFDQIFGGGVLNSMSSRLFMLREETGLFYTIKGTLVAHADEQPGMVVIKTIVSNDRLDEAVKRIKQTVDDATTGIATHEFESAKHALINSLSDGFSTNGAMAVSFLFQHSFKLPADYFAQRAQSLDAISLDSMIEAVQKVLRSDKLVCIKVGRQS